MSSIEFQAIIFARSTNRSASMRVCVWVYVGLCVRGVCMCVLTAYAMASRHCDALTIRFDYAFKSN